jgi:hypothetical protein
MPAAADIDIYDDPEMSGRAPSPGSWRGRPPLSLRLGNPTRAFRTLAIVFAPLAFLRLLVLPGAAFAATAATFNYVEMQIQLGQIALTISFVQSFILGLLTTNLMAKVIQGTVMAHLGAYCDEFGTRLAFGVKPKFYIFKGSIKSLSFANQRYCYAAPLLFRLSMYAVGVLVWIVLLPSGSSLTNYALSLALAGLASFLFTANPLFPEDGYHYLATTLERPKLRNESFRLIGMLIRFKPVPPDLPRLEFWLLLAYGVGAITFTAILIFSMITAVAFALTTELRGTGVIIFCFIIAAVMMFVMSYIERRRSRRQRGVGRQSRSR